jgi:ATP-binding cassette subfamily F protein 3
VLKPLKETMEKWEREVSRLHGDMETLDTALAIPGLFTKDPAKGEKLAKARADAARKLETAEAKWIEAAERYEAAQER